MKNFPNQASDFARLRATLVTISELVAAGSNVADDDLLGYELAKRRQYTFRGFDYSGSGIDKRLAERIAEEKEKPGASQGARTNAREMRRTLRALGWIDGVGDLTSTGLAILETQPGSLDERAQLASSMWNIRITDNDGTSHPVQILLKLLDEAPARRRDGLELVLEAEDDSTAEWERVRALYAFSRETRRQLLHAKGVTDNQIANAVKIFPALARTAGLVVEDRTGRMTLSPDGKALVELPQPNPAEVIEAGAERSRRSTFTHRRVTQNTIASRTGDVERKFLDEDDQKRAAELLAERTTRHQDLVRATAKLVKRPGEIYEDPASFDLLFVPDDESVPLVLFEMKTLSDDVNIQVRNAVGQLSYYHYFNVSPHWPERTIIEVAVVDHRLPSRLTKYLASEEVAAVLVDQDQNWSTLNEVLQDELPKILQLPSVDA